MTNTTAALTDSTAYPTNATFLAHTAHADRARRDDACRLCADHGATGRVTWAQFTAEYPLWNARRVGSTVALESGDTVRVTAAYARPDRTLYAGRVLTTTGHPSQVGTVVWFNL